MVRNADGTGAPRFAALGCPGCVSRLRWGRGSDSAGQLGIRGGMESGSAPHQPWELASGLVPVGKPYRRPLLPYERQLIELAGCSEEEYQQFNDELLRRYLTRPAPLDGVPEITAGPVVPILINLVIGIAISAVSYLLMPKPRMPSMNERGGGQRTLSSVAGLDRFAQTTGFDSAVQLAEYGSAVPIIWTRYVEETGTGGVLVSPRLVWSRMFSEATHQAMKLLFVVGEAGVQPPDISGIYIGNNGLDALSSNNFAFYWNQETRPERIDQLYGEPGYGPLTGDPQQTSDLFVTSTGVKGFSQALTPSNTTQFGVSNPIPNGTQYRVNFRIVSAPESADNGRPSLLRDRMKVAGFTGPVENPTNRGMGGIGYGFFRRQGIFGYNSKQTIGASVGSTIRYVISGNVTGEFYFGGQGDSAGGGDTNDVDNSLDSECAAADDLLQLGETIIINHSLWRVVDRTLATWNPGTTQIVTLRCIEILDSAEVRVLGDQYITTREGDTNLAFQAPDQSFKNAGAVFDNLARVNIGAVKNTRPCEATHIGIRSQVWGRFNGLCNFNSLLSGKQVRELDRKNISVQSGTMSDYFMRTSAFTIYYREIGQTAWVKTRIYFCVRGATPTDQFHQIAVLHGENRALEFRLVPVTAALLNRLSPSHQLYWLNADVEGQQIAGNGITLFARYRLISVQDCRLLPQMISNPPGDPDAYRVFEESTGVAEVSHYGSLITRSCDSGPEHSIVYLNEFVRPRVEPTYDSLTMAGLAIRSNRSVSSVEQMRVWIGRGISNSNSFPRLVSYLLSRSNELSSQLIDQSSLSAADGFCNSRGLLFDGAISERVNLRQYIADMAPFFLLNFVIANGKFSLMPAIPSGLPAISNLFTAGNIIEGSFNVEYLQADQRKDFQALITYRTHLNKNDLPELRTYRARFANAPASAPVESFDMSAFCTSRRHAEQVARYFLSIRRRVTHAIRFKTAPEDAGIAPGSYIKVALQQNVVSSFGNGVVSAVDGRVTSAMPLADGTYSIVYYVPGAEDVQTASLTISNGIAAETQIWGALFALQSGSVETSTYLVEQVEVDEDGLVNVTATEFPASLINSDMSGAGIVVEET